MGKTKRSITDRYHELANTWGVENDSKEFWDKMKELGDAFELAVDKTKI